MSEARAHRHIATLKEQLIDGRIARREFLRYATLLGLSSAAAYGFVGQVTGEAPIAAAMAQPNGGTLKMAMRVHDVSNPHTFSWVRDSNVARQVCEYLTRTGHDNVTRPYLVESWEASDDLKSWTLTLRDDVKWHSGRVFTAEDVAANLRHALDPENGSSILGLMKGYMMDETGGALWSRKAVEILGDHRLRLNLKVPQVAVPEHLFHYPLLILDPAEGFKFGPGSNGTGAFELIEHEVGVKSVLHARDDYWGEGPFLQQITFLDMGDDPSAAIGAFASGQVDAIDEGDISQIDILKVIPDVRIHSAETAQTAVARVQVDRPEFADPRVRQALRLAIDPDRVLEIAHRGIGRPAEHHHVCPIHPDYHPLEPFRRDLAKAKELLAQAGASGLKTTIVCKKDPPWELAAVQAMVEMWKEADIEVEIELLPSSQFWDRWDKVPFGFTEWTHRPLGFMVLGLAYRSDVPWNESHYSNADFDARLTDAEGTLNIEDRKAIMMELETILQEDGPIVQPLWRSVFAVAKSSVRGFSMHPTSYIFGEEIWLA